MANENPNGNKQISISSPKYFSYSMNLGLIVRFYEEILGKGTYELKLLGVMAAMELTGHIIPSDIFEYYGYCLDYAVNKRIVIGVDGSKTPIPPFDPDDPMCKDCHELVDIAIVNYAFIAHLEGDPEIPMKDYLGGVFTFSGVAFEGVEAGYHLDGSQEAKEAYEAIRSHLCPNPEASEAYGSRLRMRLDTLKGILERSAA